MLCVQLRWGSNLVRIRRRVYYYWELKCTGNIIILAPRFCQVIDLCFGISSFFAESQNRARMKKKLVCGVVPAQILSQSRVPHRR